MDVSYLEDSSVANVADICGKKFRKPRLKREEKIVDIWSRPNSDEFFDRIKAEQYSNCSQIKVGQSTKQLDLSDMIP